MTLSSVPVIDLSRFRSNDEQQRRTVAAQMGKAKETRIEFSFHARTRQAVCQTGGSERKQMM